MQIQVTELEPCKLLVNYEANAEEILNKRAEVLNVFKNAPVPGFRNGKATLDAIKVHYRNQIEESLKRALAEDAYHNTLFEKKIKPHGSPQFTSVLLADGKFACEFGLYVRPNFDLASYLGLEIPKPHQAVSSLEMTEKILQDLRVRFGDSEPYTENDFVQNTDSVILNYEGTIDGVKQENLCAESEMLTVGASPLKDFDDNLLGMKPGEVREFNVVIPENGLPSLAGKTVHFTVTLTIGSKNIPCPLNDELAVKMGKSTLLELREFVQATAAGRVANATKIALAEAVANRLTSDNNFEIPNWMSLSEAQYLTHNAKLDWNTMNDADKEMYLGMAEKNVKLALILDKVRESEPEAQLTDQEVLEMIKQSLASNNQGQATPEDVIKQMSRTGYLQVLFARIKDEHTLDFLVKSAKITE